MARSNHLRIISTLLIIAGCPFARPALAQPAPPTAEQNPEFDRWGIRPGYWFVQPAATLVAESDAANRRAELEDAAENGDGKALALLAAAWNLGTFGAKDFARAIGYADRAIERGQPRGYILKAAAPAPIAANPSEGTIYAQATRPSG
ncbi:MAG: hypothetical protein ACOYLS_10905 [Polymorphobacter sp.]